MIGAGMMGAAIAYVAARAGIEVVLKDVTLAGAQKGKSYAVKLEQKAVERGKTTEDKAERAAGPHPSTATRRNSRASIS